jgi:hypothetical protein
MTKVPLTHVLPEEVQGAGLVIDFGPDGMVFNKELIITMPYNDANDDGIVDDTDLDEKNVTAFRYDEGMMRWLCLKRTNIDILNNIVTYETDHFSEQQCAVIDTSVYGRDDAYFFTIDGLKLKNTAIGFLFPVDFDLRSAYLEPSLIGMADFHINNHDVYSYGEQTGEESWDGDANRTPDIISSLVEVLSSEYNKQAICLNKKFIMVTHSWGTVLADLALRYAYDVEPDLLITLSSPRGTINQLLLDPDLIFSAINGITSLQVAQTLVGAYVGAEIYLSEFTMFWDEGKLPKVLDFYNSPGKKWINCWTQGDLISGPLLSEGIQNYKCEDELQNHPGTQLVLANTLVWHALTSLDDRDGGYWEGGVTPTYTMAAEQFKTDVEAMIRNFCPTGLVAYYPFNGNANDESGNEYNSIVYGATPTSDRKGNPNSAYDFDGINDWIHFPNTKDNLIFQNQISLTFWIKMRSSAPYYFPYHLPGMWQAWGSGQRYWDMAWGVIQKLDSCERIFLITY